MERLISKFETRLIAGGLVDEGEAVLIAADDCVFFNKEDDRNKILVPLFSMLSINALVFARPAQPYQAAMDYVASESGSRVKPRDSESRTFLHDIPVVKNFITGDIAKALRRRKCAIIPGHGLIAAGTISIEQAFIAFSSACFACFVKFFSDLYNCAKNGLLEGKEALAYEKAKKGLLPIASFHGGLAAGPFHAPEEIRRAMAQAGKELVSRGLVDASFGNISYAANSHIYISRTGSFLDELENEIDAVPFDGSSCTGITASSELPAHMGIVAATGYKAVLHGHPRFCVILSMVCLENDCKSAGECHRACPKTRYVCGYPVVAGEIGSGPFSLAKRVPGVISERSCAIVYGHGVFTTGHQDFNHALQVMVEAEQAARKEVTAEIERNIYNAGG